jgi:CheY-like chemotaxis protein
MSNAIKFTEEGSVTLYIKNKANDIVEFSIKDTGIGLSIDQIDKLFTPFTQGDSSITRKYGGTGLGLSISKQLVQLLNGNIWVESKEKEGSIFFFEVPLSKYEEIEEPKTSNIKVKDNQKKVLLHEYKNQEILIVEDNMINQEIIKGLLENTGMILTSVFNGKEAVDKVRLHPTKYNLILMDMKMPIMSGLEASKIIRTYNETVPIIVITANTLDSDKEIACASGINDYLHKPIDIELLYSMLHQYLSSFKAIEKQTITNDLDILQNLKCLDTKLALGRLNGNHKLYLKILQDFKKNYQSVHFSSIIEKDFALKIHTLKGLSGNIGAEALYDIVTQVEQHEDENLLDSLNARLKEVID